MAKKEMTLMTLFEQIKEREAIVKATIDECQKLIDATAKRRDLLKTQLALIESLIRNIEQLEYKS